jgi:hypothetical protein
VTYAIEAWTFPTDGDEEPCEQELVKTEEFTNLWQAQSHAWDWMEEGFFVRMWRR